MQSYPEEGTLREGSFFEHKKPAVLSGSLSNVLKPSLKKRPS